MRWLILFLLYASQTMPLTSSAALPARLVLLLDGVSYRDVKALQEGVGDRPTHLQAFRQG